MGLMKNMKEKMYHGISQKFKRPQILGLDTLERTVRDFSLPASILSLGAKADSTIIERVIHGPYDTASKLYGIISAYVQDVGIRSGSVDVIGQTWDL